MAGVPFRYDAEARAYKVPSTFKFPGISSSSISNDELANIGTLLPQFKKTLADGERFVAALRELCEALEK